MFAALSTRLWFLQVLATEVYAAGSPEQQRAHRSRPTRCAARSGPRTSSRGQAGRRRPRRSSRTARASRSASTSRSSSESGRAEQVLLRLSEMLDIPVEEIKRQLADKQYFDYQPKPIAEFVDEEVALLHRGARRRVPGCGRASTRASATTRWAPPPRTSLGLGRPDRRRPVEAAPTARATATTTWWARPALELPYEKWLRGRKGVAALRGELRRRDDPQPRRGRPHRRRRPGAHARLRVCSSPPRQRSAGGHGAHPHDLRR